MLLVRHGETLSNLDRRYHGRLDSPLTERGVAQANAIGRHIATLLKGQSAEIVSSPQPRALRTAELIRERLGSIVGPVMIDNRLCEISIGEWEGLGHDEIAACAPRIFDGDGRYEWCFGAGWRDLRCLRGPDRRFPWRHRYRTERERGRPWKD
jgi:broad specificity phosphatase PhoE